jgi:hypothetical protein
MKKKMARYEIDLSNPPCIDSSAESGVEGSPGQPETEIDYSEVRHCERIFGRRRCGTRFTGPRRLQPLVRIDFGMERF